jgi:hypothetical protein
MGLRLLLDGDALSAAVVFVVSVVSRVVGVVLIYRMIDR